MTARRAPSREAALLAQGLSELRERTGLSLIALAAKTTYSKSSWERYLNGKALPPRPAIEELCALADEPPKRLKVLLDLAVRSQAAATVPVAEPPSPPTPEVPSAPTPRKGAPWRPVIAAGIALGCLLVTGVSYALWPESGDAPAAAPWCHGLGCAGRSPASTLCAQNAVTVSTGRSAQGAQIEIRYSRPCEAVWARLGRSQIGDLLTVTTGSGRPQDVRVADDYDAAEYVYTPMASLGGRRQVRACLTQPTGREQCFQGQAH